MGARFLDIDAHKQMILGASPVTRFLPRVEHAAEWCTMPIRVRWDGRIPFMRLCRLVAYASAAIACIWLCCHNHNSIRADETTGLFNSDPQHVSNQLYRQLHVRTEPGGKEYGLDALDPLLWRETNYLLIGESYTRALALADKFLRTHAEQQINDPTKRAILQRDLWAVFDWADPPAQEDPAHQDERRELMARLAPIIRRLSLSSEELAALPDTYAGALKNREFPAKYDPVKPDQAFLPPNLFDASGPWVCLGAPNHDLAAPGHDSSFTARSVFFVFARLPGGRDATLAYFKQLADMKIPLFVSMQESGWPQPMDVWNPKVPQFPVGTEFVLVRKMVLPDLEGNLRVTPVTENVQIRHYTEIPRVNPGASRDVDLAQRFQEASEVELSRPLLFSGQRSGLRGVVASDESFGMLPAMSQGFDDFEEPRMRERHSSPLAACKGCHLGPGIQSMMSFSFRRFPSEGAVFSPRLAETTPSKEAGKILEWAQTQEKWKHLLLLWSAENPN
jgi:hypothetical protein